VATLAGCGGSDGDGNGIGSVDGFCAALLDALAAKKHECEPTTLAAEKQAMIRGGFCSRVKTAVDAKTINFDSSKAQACLDHVKAESCTMDEIQQETPCDLALAGQVAHNGACHEDEECAGWGYCERINDACPGVCKDPGASQTGGPCANGQICLGDTYCAPGGTCEAVVRVNDGQPCDNAGVQCKDGFYCDGTCQARKTTGTCGGEDECVARSTCNIVCSQPKKVGEACSIGECDMGAYCAGGTCADWPTSGACGAIGGEIVGCLEGYCADINGLGVGTCKPPKADGEDCDALPGDLECASFNCNTTTGKCEAASACS
jgi:hypothetical protein